MLRYSLFVFFAAVQVVRSVVVNCPEGQLFCNCPVGEPVCEFTLAIENRQTFTSYKLVPDGSMSNAGTPYINQNSTVGFLPAIRGVNRPCLFDDDISLVEDEDFTSRGCSPPITVDGISKNRNIITINGISPGPTLVVDSGATILAHVVNDLLSTSEETSIHWHGMYQRHTPWMDGVGRITQPSIEHGTSFDYIFQASPVGTHWYHSHVGLQRTEGMYGALVVRGDSPPDSNELVPEENGNANIIDMPEIFTMTLYDWQKVPAVDLFLMGRTLGFSPNMPAVQILTGQGVTPVERGVKADGTDLGPIPFFSGLINGRGRFQNTVTPLSVFSVGGGTYILFRVVGAMSRDAYMLSIDNHTLRVIATDGKNVQFKDVDYISVETGERYDFLVNVSETTGNYWIRAETLQVNVPVNQEYSARAILSYEGAESLDWRNGYSNVPESRRTCTPDNPCKVLNCPFQDYASSSNMRCVSLLDLIPRPMKSQEQLPKFPPNADCFDCMYFLNFAFEGDGGIAETEHSVNASSFELPPKAYQTHCRQYDEDNSNDSMVNTCEKNCPDPPSGGCECINVIPLANQAVFIDDKANTNLESIVMVFSGISAKTSHPIHVHGHAFQVVYVGYGTYDENGTLNSTTTDLTCDEPCTNPRWADGVPAGVTARTVDGRVTNAAIQKDTVVIPAGGYVVIAFNADNPGYWYIHCHIEDHTAGGMVALLQEYSPDQQWLPPPGINIPGDFTWSIDDYNEHIDAALMCADAPTTPSSAKITISRAGFGIALAILILLAIACVVLAVLLIIFCIKAKSDANSSFKEMKNF